VSSSLAQKLPGPQSSLVLQGAHMPAGVVRAWETPVEPPSVGRSELGE
jgi:hypothetical protein